MTDAFRTSLRGFFAIVVGLMCWPILVFWPVGWLVKRYLPEVDFK